LEEYKFKVRSSELRVGSSKTKYSWLRTTNSELKTNYSELRTHHSELFARQSGFTFIEVILVLMIIGILSAILIPRLGILTTPDSSLNGAAYIIGSDIRYAQEYAMANRVSKSVIFTSGSSAYTFNPTSGLDPSGKLPSNITISNNFTITFNSLGEPTTGGGGSVMVSNGVQTKTIGVVNYTGKVNIS